MATITHTQVRAVVAQAVTGAPDTTLYRVTDTVTAVTGGIGAQVFVFSTDDQEFNHVATVSDMTTLRNSRQAALDNGDAYYRDSAVTQDYVRLSTAIEFSVMLKDRLTSLAKTYSTVLTNFSGSVTETLG